MAKARRPRDGPSRKIARLAARVRRCRACGLHRSRTHAVPGQGPPSASLVLVGEAPGRDEDRTGRPFQGAAGRVLDGALDDAGIPRDAVFITNVVKCRPPGNRRPSAHERETCLPFLHAQLEAVRPRAIVAMGRTATEALLGPRPSFAGVRGRWRTFAGIPVLPTYHPAAILYRRTLLRDLVRHLRRARARAGGR